MPFPPLVAPVAELSAAEMARTARHVSLAGLGELGQRRLAAAHVAIVGAGGLGSPAILALAAAGVGTITVIDDDVVDATNLQRQVIHRFSDVGAAKTDSASRAAADLSPETTIRGVRRRLDADTAVELLRGADVVLDGTDSFATRAIVASACETLGIPLVWGVVQEFHAQVTVFWSSPPEGTDAVVLADLYPPETVGELPTCSQVSVLGALTMQVGSVMATEAIKLIAGIGEPLFGRVLLIDALRAQHTEVALRGSGVRLSTRTAPPVAALPPQLDLDHALAAQAAGATLLDVREPTETATGMIPGAVAVPLGEVIAGAALPTDAPIVVVCEVGQRAAYAARVLRESGVDASVLAGGMVTWRSALAAGRVPVPGVPA